MHANEFFLLGAEHCPAPPFHVQLRDDASYGSAFIAAREIIFSQERGSSFMFVRAPAVAGVFYPAESGELRGCVAAELDDAKAAPNADPNRWPKAIIAPHAGFGYSGPI